MATVTRENIGLLNDKITVKVSQEDYLPNYDKAVKQLSKTANIPGFRKGMVPAGMVKKMHGQAIFADEVLKTVEKELTGYLQNEKVEIFAQPLSLEKEAKNFDHNNPTEYNFDFEIGLKPAFEVTPLQDGKTTLSRYKIKVTSEMLDKEVENLLERGGKNEETDKVSSENDFLTVKFEESDEAGNVLEGGIQKENAIKLKQFSAPIQEQLKGKGKGDSIVFFLATSFDAAALHDILHDLGFHGHNDADAQRYFKLTIEKVEVIVKRELNEEFFKEVFPKDDVTTEEAFREKLKSEIEKYWDSESRNHLHNELFEVLVHETPIELPKEFLKRWLQQGGEKPKTAEEAEKENRGRNRKEEPKTAEQRGNTTKKGVKAKTKTWFDVVKGLKIEDELETTNSDVSGIGSEVTDSIEMFDSDITNRLRAKRRKGHQKRRQHCYSKRAEKGHISKQADQKGRAVRNQTGQGA